MILKLFMENSIMLIIYFRNVMLKPMIKIHFYTNVQMNRVPK